MYMCVCMCVCAFCLICICILIRIYTITSDRVSGEKHLIKTYLYFQSSNLPHAAIFPPQHLFRNANVHILIKVRH